MGLPYSLPAGKGEPQAALAGLGEPQTLGGTLESWTEPAVIQEGAFED